MSAATNDAIMSNMPVTEPAFRSMIRVHGLLRRVMEPYFSRFGISGAQWGVLRALWRAEAEGVQSLRVTDLSSRLLVQPPSTTGVLDRLQRMGLIQRKACKDDQRARNVSLTPAGHQLVQRVLQQHPTQVTAVMAGLTLSEQQDLCRLVDKLGSHLEAIAQKSEQPAAPADGVQ